MSKHILKTDFGVNTELGLNEKTGDLNCVWEGLPKSQGKFKWKQLEGEQKYD
jgi:hypothetical protein